MATPWNACCSRSNSFLAGILSRCNTNVPCSRATRLGSPVLSKFAACRLRFFPSHPQCLCFLVAGMAPCVSVFLRDWWKSPNRADRRLLFLTRLAVLVFCGIDGNHRIPLTDKKPHAMLSRPATFGLLCFFVLQSAGRVYAVFDVRLVGDDCVSVSKMSCFFF